jgi:hypothetical protein
VHLLNSADKSFYLHDLSLMARPNPARLEEIGEGLNFETHSQLLEWRYQVAPRNQIFYAHRIDFPDVSEEMFSPRLSLVSSLNDTNTLVTTLQRAQRMMPLRAQYLNHKYNQNSAHETLDGLELSYTNSDLKNTSINLRSFYNDINAVGYTGSRLEFLTGVELYGVEISATYKVNHIELTLNHSYVDTLSVDMNPALKTGNSRNNISYADYYYKTKGDIPVLLESYGSGLNNWSKNSTKFLATQKFFNQRLVVHLNAQVFWDYTGSYDELQMYQSAYDNFDVSSLPLDTRAAFELQREQFEREHHLLDNSGAFKVDYNLNASISYVWPMNNDAEVQLKVFAENILSSKRRYNVSTGSNRFFPERLNFMAEPNVFGVSLSLNY